MRAGLHAFVAADAVGRILCNGVLVDPQDVHLANDSLRAGFHALPAGLADMGIDKDMLRLMLGRPLEWISFHGGKGTADLCFQTITIVKKSFASADSAQRYRRNAEIGRKIMLRNAGDHFRMLFKQQLVPFLRRVLDAGKEELIVIDHSAVGKLGNGDPGLGMLLQKSLNVSLLEDFKHRRLNCFDGHLAGNLLPEALDRRYRLTLEEELHGHILPVFHETLAQDTALDIEYAVRYGTSRQQHFPPPDGPLLKRNQLLKFLEHESESYTDKSEFSSPPTPR